MTPRRRLAPLLALVAVLGASSSSSSLAEGPGGDGWRPLFNGEDLSGWTLREPARKDLWVVCDEVRVDPSNPGRLIPVGDGGGPDAVLLNGGDGRGTDLVTTESFDDFELHLEFNVPKGSNSGIYLRGLYEIQIFDSFGSPRLAFHDCGALYERAHPSENHARPPGEWQSFDITMKGRRLTLLWNGQEVYRDRDIRYGETDEKAFLRLTKENAAKAPELRVKLEEKDGKFAGYFGEGGTRGAMEGPDRPGPFRLQGDHGPVAFRHIRIRPLDGR